MVARTFSILVVSFLVLSSLIGIAQADPPMGNVVITASTTWPEATYTLDSLTVKSGATLNIAGGSTVNVIGTVSLMENSTILLQGKDTGAKVAGVWQGTGVTLTVAEVSIDAGSKISADGQGYGAGLGNGTSTDVYSGGSYGGKGNGNSAAATYGSALTPTDPGSGGGPYGSYVSIGGGVIRLIVSGTLTNNGVISSNGSGSGYNSGASGGSIWVTTGTLTGSGIFTANSLPGHYSNGGGGRVAVYYRTNSGYSGFATSTATGATNGSVAFLDNSQANNHLYVYQQFPLFDDTVAIYDSITVDSGGTLSIGGGSDITVTGTVTVKGTSTILFQSKNVTAQINGAWVGSGATMRAANIQIAATGKISADGQGYGAGMGPGSTTGTVYSGGSYGGQGSGTAVGAVYGSALTPIEPGSGGGQYYSSISNGGGVIRLIVSGILTNSGTISANGTGSGSNSGASGGSIYITTGTLAGSGLAGTGIITANGLAGFYSHGGGGRVAVYYTTIDPLNQYDLTSITAKGGGSGASAGTVNTLVSNGDLIVSTNNAFPDGSIVTYNNIVINNGGILTIGKDSTIHAANITVTAGGIFTVGGGSTLDVTATILVTGNSTILLQSKNTTAQINGTWAGSGVTVNAGNIQVDSGSKISADGQGYGAGLGNGTSTDVYSGGSYGGKGNGNSAAATYGSALTPTDPGSGGGPYGSYVSIGGGVIRLIVSGTLTNNGVISSNGSGSGYNSGASGGSIWVTTGTLTGSGIFTANSLPGNYSNGGGGRVAVYYRTNSGYSGFSTSTATGATNGSVAFLDNSHGTNHLYVYQQFPLFDDTVATYDSITVDSGGTLSIGGGSDITVTGTVTVKGTSTILFQSKNVTAQINGAWVGSGATMRAVNIQVDATGKISADGQGYGAGMGPGSTTGTVYSGGSFGGKGSGTAAGATYGSAQTPTDPGSGGGQYYSSVSNGGGVIRLIVSGTLTNNGVISANGSGSGNNSGASGGSVWVTTGTLAGSGIFTANGYDGTYSKGGGGRVAVYYRTNSGYSGFATSTAVATPDATNGSIAFLDNSPTNHRLYVYQQFPFFSDTIAIYDSITVDNGGTLSIGGGSDISVTGTITVKGNSTILTQSRNNSSQANATLRAGNIQVDAGSRISADGEGYGAGKGAGTSTDVYSGGSYGGKGSGTAAGAIYGSAQTPTEPGSGGGPYGSSVSNGGGAMLLLVAGTLTNNGTISSNGSGSAPGSGASGGSILVSTKTLAGSGIITANGSVGTYSQGGGGRVAVYYLEMDTVQSFNLASITAGGSGTAQPGSVLISNSPHFSWIRPVSDLMHDTVRLEWAALAVDFLTTTVDIVASRATAQNVIGARLNSNSGVDWDTRSVADGQYELRLIFRDANGLVLGEAPRSVLVNNSVKWHLGTIAVSETWSTDKIHGIEGTLIIPAGVTITVDPGTVIKAQKGARIVVQDGGIFNALGTDVSRIILTALDDDSVGGDTNFDGSQTKPLPGEWFGFGIQGSGQFNLNTFTDLRYMQTVRSGTLSANETWLGSYLYHVTGDVVVPSGVTLTIEPGAIIKFDVVKGITVQSGGRLVANGTIAEPIYFTSIKDDSVGGDTNGDGNTTSPSAGDWQWLYINGGQASFNHAVINYGGGNSYGSWNGTGVILTSGSAAVTVANSVIRQSFYDGILAWGGTVEVTNTVLTGIDRAVCAHPGSPVKVTNCTLDGNRIGLLVHGGTMDVVNTIVANSSSAGIQYDYGTLNSVRYSDVWTSVPGAVNYSPGPDLSGSNGNISVSPLFKNRAQGDYRLDYHSPAIDAADGAVVPVTDVMGAPRYDDPRTLNTGTATAMGAYSDMGAYEFVESADSDVDLVVSGVTGPASALVGSQVQLSWTVTNNGTGYAVGPWHDAVYLVRNPDAAKVEIFVGETIVGQNVILGPGQSFIATAIVTVPGSEIGAHRWEIMANSRGELFEGKNSGNNSGVSAAKVTIDLQELVVDAPSLPGLFTAAGQSFWYKMTPGVNKDIKVSLAIGANAGTGQLYIGQGYLPDRQHYDFTQQEWNSAVATAQVPGSASQVYYVLAYDPTLSSASANFTLAAKTSTFSVTTVQPGFVSNNGTATLEITGGQLSTRAQFSLVSPNSTVYNPLYLFVADPSHAYATFNLTGLATGGYGMQVTDNGSTVTEANAVTVIAGSGSLIEYSIITPKAVRAGGSGTATVTYKNVGGTDAMAPLMWLTASGANLGHIDPFCMNVPGGLGYDAVSDTTMLRCQELKKQNTFTSGKILGINNEGPAGILPPGAGGSVSFEMDPVITSDYVDFTVSDVSDPDTPMDWNGLKNSMKPVFVPVEAWDAVFANMSSTIGSTMGQFNAALAADATYLSSFGRYESKANNLISFELMKAGLATIIPRYTLGSFGRGASHPFDISGEIQDGNIVLHYPVGNIRQLKLDSVITGKYNGIGGDYGVLTVNSTDQSWNLTEIDGTLSHFKVDPNNAVQYVIDFIQDLNGNKVSVNYTGSVVTSITSTTGDTQQFSYNSQGRINQTIDAVGRISTYSYDTSGEHLLSVTVPRGTTSFTYVTGQGAASEHAVGSITYPDGTSRSFEYDSMGRLTKKSLNGGVETLTLAYEASGAVTVTDATGSSTRILPDEYGQIGQIDDPLGAVTRFSYDPWHNLISVQAPEGTSVSFGYDAHGNRTTLFDPAGNRQNFGYGSYGNLISLTDSLDNMLGYSYDTRDNNTAITYPDGSAAKAEYDVRGNLLKWTNRRGRSVVYAYDTYNLLTRKTHADGSQVNYSYDSHRNLQSLTSSSGTTSFSYDSADRLTGITYPNGRSVQYMYNSNGQRISMADQSGFAVNYGYDAVGRLSRLSDGSGSSIVAYTYDAAGRIDRKTMGNGTYTTYSYNAAGSLLQLANHAANDSVNSSFTYTYDLLGRKTGMTAPDGIYAYSYDSAGQLIAVTPPVGGVIHYHYDAAGNRTTTTASGTTTSYSSNSLNEYTAVGGTTYSYDTDGNLIGKTGSGGTWSYQYDDENRLVSMTGDGVTWTYEYDGLGNRVAQTRNGLRTEYLIDPTGLGNVIAEYDGTGALQKHYTYGLDLASALPSGGTHSYYHFDGSGNTAQITGAAGSIQNSYTFLPFGEKISSSETMANPFTFVGQYGVRDDGNGLYNMRNRWYDPALGRFTRPDPLGIGGGDANLYRYVGNRPTDLVDPMGLDSVDTGRTISSTLVTMTNIALNQFAGSISDLDEFAVFKDTVTSLNIMGLGLSAAQFAYTAHKYNNGNADGLQLIHDGGKVGASSLFIIPLLATTTAGAGLVAIAPVVATVAVVAGVADLVTDKPLTWFMNYWYDSKANDPSNWGPRARNRVPVLSSYDPNLKITVGYGTQGYVTGDTTLQYTIDFENMSTATAAALKVVVTDQLNSNLDWSSMQLISYGFNNTNNGIPGGLQAYTGEAKVSTDPNPVKVNAAFNPATGLITWTMESFDPVTGGVPEDPYAGFLPPNDATHRGEGYVTFSIKPKPGLADGTAIANKATIVFDVNTPIDTNIVTNTIDLTIPTSSVNVLPTTTPASFTVSWGGSDTGSSGIAGYDVYVKTDNGAYIPWLTGTATTSATYDGVVGHSYAFYSIATDNVGHRQTQVGSVVSTTTSSTITKAGDCDANGTVTIAEVQSAINMFLGLKTVALCVDTNGDTTVSIAEVQKTINSFLGL